MAAWKVAWRAASYAAWNAASSVSQRDGARRIHLADAIMSGA